ncbi:hypothetical protein L9F63_025990, partial [Diploptera punctata]
CSFSYLLDITDGWWIPACGRSLITLLSADVLKNLVLHPFSNTLLSNFESNFLFCAWTNTLSQNETVYACLK